MARPKKGEKRLGDMRPCKVCGKLLYRSPSKLKQKKTYCKEHKWKDAFSFTCEVCGKKVFTQPAQMKYRHRKTCSIKCRSRYRTLQAEERRKNGVMTQHQIDRAIRYCKKASDWRKAVFARDNYTCQICKVRGTYLEADHIKPWAYFPELRFELSNGRTLCRKCHDKTKMDFRTMRKIYVKTKTNT